MRGDADTEAALLYTSGTTGKPKGCMLSNDYFLTLGDAYIGLGVLCPLDGDDRLLTPLPPNHMNALVFSFMGMLMCGGCVIQLTASTREWWRTVRESATIIHYRA
jgi:long-subunit acyl-CoA synthetase (AMP-forming)